MERRLQGQRDSPLTPRGVAQAKAAGVALRAHFGVEWSPTLFSSPLGRASRTEALLAEQLYLSPEPNLDVRLAEVSFGEFEGLTQDEVQERFPDLAAQRRKDKWHFVHPDGESYAGTYGRVSEFLTGIADSEQVVVVAHSGIGRVVRGCYLDLEPADLAYMRHPQDEIYLLTNGQSTTLETGSV